MASRADLAKRVGAVLDSRQRRGRAGAAPVALACAAAAALVLTMAPLTVVGAPQPAVMDTAAGAPILDPAPLPAASAPQSVTKAPGASPIVKPAPILMAAAPQTPAADASGAPMARFSAVSMLTIVNVAATDRNGNSLDDLKAGDFVIAEDGAPQRIMIFEYQKVDATPQGAGRPYYILGYYPSNTDLDGKYRRINLTLRGNTAAKLDYRAGYFIRKAGTSVADSAPGPGATFPQLLHKFDPEYSEEARKAKYQGTVALQITVNTDGSVGDILVRRSLGLGLDEKAIEAVKQWKFRPGMKDLAVAPMQAEVVVSFRLL
jgi:TonB family protein